MNKILLIVLAGFTSLGLSAATLDVHGDIKISGKMVINENGEWVGKPITQADTSFDLNEYTSMDGRILHYTTDYATPGGSSREEGTAVYDYSKPDQFKEYEYDKDGILRWGVERQSTGSNSFVNYFPTFNITSNVTFDVIVPKSQRWELNKTYSSIIAYQVSSTDEDDGKQQEFQYEEVTTITPIALLNNYSQGEAVKNAECVVYSLSEINSEQYRIACKGIGFVKIWKEEGGNTLVLASVEQIVF